MPSFERFDHVACGLCDDCRNFCVRYVDVEI
jgi:hypothetical protein